MHRLVALRTAASCLLPAVVYCLGPPPVGSTYDLEKIYDISFDSNVLGNCHAYQTQIEKSYLQALEMADNAKQAMDDLQQARPPDHQETELDNWLRKAQVYRSMFGEDIPQTGWTQAGNPNAATVRGQFQNYVNRQIISTNTPPPFIIRCNDDWLEYQGPFAPDPDGETFLGQPKQIRETDQITLGGNRIPFTQGAFVAQKGGVFAMPVGKRKFWFPGLTPSSQQLFCPGTARASTDMVKGLIVLCPLLLDNTRWSLDQQKTETQAGSFIETGQVPSIGQIMFHEWAHLISHDRDLQAVDQNGQNLPDVDGKPQLTYGWSLASFLANHDAATSTTNPDNYVFFAMAMYFSDFYWATGYAKGEPE